MVVPFTAPGADGNSSGCATAAASLVDDILANRSGYYLADDFGTLLTVEPNEKSLGFPTVRLEIKF